MSENKDQGKIQDSPKAQQRTGGLQRSQEEGDHRSRIKAAIKEKVHAIRHGFGTGGYCDTEGLVAGEKQLHCIISAEIEEAQIAHDQAQVRKLERELAGLCYRPKLVVAKEELF
jgi:hypothetical protein